MDYIQIIAIISSILSIVATLCVPLLFGKDRGKYNYSSFISNIISTTFIILMSLRILNIL